MFRSYQRHKQAGAKAPRRERRNPDLAGAGHGCLLRSFRFAAAAVDTGGRTMKNPLDSIWGTIISGLVLTVVLVVAAKSFLA
jgi:uncharacterized membrane protein YkvI